MAKKKDLKHSINCICSDLFAEAVAASLYGAEKEGTDAQQLLSSIIVLTILSSASHILNRE